MAYGRGNQTSTKLCIKELENLFKARKVGTVLDVGCGTGVLAICAVALGANMALALDVDPVAVEETKTNVNKMGFSCKIQVVYDSLDGAGDRFDLVLANLTTTQILRSSRYSSSFCSYQLTF